jgi:hypothetical protein
MYVRGVHAFANEVKQCGRVFGQPPLHFARGRLTKSRIELRVSQQSPTVQLNIEREAEP